VGLENPTIQGEEPAQTNKLEKLWAEALKDDRQYRDAVQAVLGQEQRFPSSLGVKCSISECLVTD
jgi:hypothetical protein